MDNTPPNPNSAKKIILFVLAVVIVFWLGYSLLAQKPKAPTGAKQNFDQQSDVEVENQEEQPILKQ